MKNDYTKKIFLLAIFSAFTCSCSRSKETTTFAEICRNEDQTEISIRGFLKTPSTASGLSSQGFLLVENENGTGGFIQIETTNEENFSNTTPVKITGEIVKTENSCVLKLTKIETP
jgi:hypothetical protein